MPKSIDLEKIQLRNSLTQKLQEAQQQNNIELESRIVKDLKINLRNPYAGFLDKISKIRALNFIVEYICDAISFFLPQRFKLTYNQIILPGEKGGNRGKLYLGRMISQKIVKQISCQHNLMIISMQVPEEVYDIYGKRLIIPLFSDPIIVSQNDLPEKTTLIRFAGGGVFDHCFCNANTGMTVSVAEMDRELEKAHNQLQTSNNVYVHCWAGKERSVVFVMCYLIKYYNLTLEQSSVYVKKYRILARSLRRLKQEQKDFLRLFVEHSCA